MATGRQQATLESASLSTLCLADPLPPSFSFFLVVLKAGESFLSGKDSGRVESSAGRASATNVRFPFGRSAAAHDVIELLASRSLASTSWFFDQRLNWLHEFGWFEGENKRSSTA